MENLILLFHVAAAVSIILLVLLQHGKGADMGASFGSGAAGSVFGAAGSANFLSRATAGAAALFFATSLLLTYFGANRPAGSGLLQGAAKEAPSVVAEPAKTDAVKAGAGAAKPAAKSETNTIPSSSAPSAPASKGNEIPK